MSGPIRRLSIGNVPRTMLPLTLPSPEPAEYRRERSHECRRRDRLDRAVAVAEHAAALPLDPRVTDVEFTASSVRESPRSLR